MIELWAALHSTPSVVQVLAAAMRVESADWGSPLLGEQGNPVAQSIDLELAC